MRFSQQPKRFPEIPELWLCTLTCGDRVATAEVFSDDDYSGVLRMAARHAQELRVEETGFLTARVRPQRDTWGVCAEFEVLLQRHLTSVRLIEPLHLKARRKSTEGSIQLLAADGTVVDTIRDVAADADLCERIGHALGTIFLSDHVGMDWTKLPTRARVFRGSVEMLVGLELDFFYSAHITREELQKGREATIRCATRHDNTDRGTERWQWFPIYVANGEKFTEHARAHGAELWRAPTLREAALQYMAERHADMEMEMAMAGGKGSELQEWHPVIVSASDPDRRIFLRRTLLQREFSLGELHYYDSWEESMQWISEKEWTSPTPATQILAFRNASFHPILTLDITEPMRPHLLARQVGNLLRRAGTLQDDIQLEPNTTWVVGVNQQQTIWAIPLEYHRAWLFELGPPNEHDLAEQHDHEFGYPERHARERADDQDDLN